MEDRSADGLDPDFAGSSDGRSRPRGRPPESTVLGVVETAAGSLDVGLRFSRVGALMVIDHGVQTGQAGAGSKKGRQEEERFGLNPSRVHEKSIYL